MQSHMGQMEIAHELIKTAAVFCKTDAIKFQNGCNKERAILDNCTKAVWIEKGEMKMVGEPKVVYEVYQIMNER